VQGPGRKIDVRPSDGERLADPQAGPGQDREQNMADAGCGIEQARELPQFVQLVLGERRRPREIASRGSRVSGALEALASLACKYSAREEET
jgi:hypothetical protein